MIDNVFIDENMIVSCRGGMTECDWSGKLSETKERYVMTPPKDWRALAGREGYEYFCPKCGRLVYTDYWKMS